MYKPQSACSYYGDPGHAPEKILKICPLPFAVMMGNSWNCKAHGVDQYKYKEGVDQSLVLYRMTYCITAILMQTVHSQRRMLCILVQHFGGDLSNNHLIMFWGQHNDCNTSGSLWMIMHIQGEKFYCTLTCVLTSEEE